MSETTTNAALLAQIAELQALNAELQKTKGDAPSLSLKVAQKGGISTYGLGRWPVTVYASGAVRLFEPAHVAKTMRFVIANIDKLSHGKADDSEETLATNKATTLAAAESILAAIESIPSADDNSDSAE